MEIFGEIFTLQDIILIIIGGILLFLFFVGIEITIKTFK